MQNEMGLTMVTGDGRSIYSFGRLGGQTIRHDVMDQSRYMSLAATEGGGAGIGH